jgi:hypothetical protein
MLIAKDHDRYAKAEDFKKAILYDAYSDCFPHAVIAMIQTNVTR